jgi:hypothetical protein
MNPYANVFADERDFTTVLLLSLLITTVGACLVKRLSPLGHSEGYLCGAVWGLLLLNATILTIEVVGLVGFALQAKSVLWEIWSLFFLMGSIGVFKVFPIIGIGLFAWWKIGRNHFSYSKQVFPIIITYFILNLFCAIAYFLEERLI